WLGLRLSICRYFLPTMIPHPAFRLPSSGSREPRSVTLGPGRQRSLSQHGSLGDPEASSLLCRRQFLAPRTTRRIVAREVSDSPLCRLCEREWQLRCPLLPL